MEIILLLYYKSMLNYNFMAGIFWNVIDKQTTKAEIQKK